MQKNIKPIAVALTLLSALGRLLPHPPNVTPVGSSSLFAGARINGWMAYLLPILVMAATDPLVGGYTRATPFIYLSFLISVWIGRRVGSSNSALRIGSACLLSSVQFFLITNFATWMLGTWYAKSLAGLADCYIAALPFFGYTVLGDLFFTATIFGLFALLTRGMVQSEAQSERTAHA
jgi:hypothetical protein